jgi:hypothetical protein
MGTIVAEEQNENQGIQFIVYLTDGSRVRVKFEDESSIDDVYNMLNEDIHPFIKVGKTQIIHKDTIARVKMVENGDEEKEPVNSLSTKVKPKENPNMSLFGSKK